MKNTTAFAVRNIGSNRGAPRLWLEGKMPASGGLAPNTRFRVLVERDAKRLVLKIDPEGDRRVSQKIKGEKSIPVIDINSTQLLEMFEGMDQVRVWATDEGLCVAPLATQERVQRRLERLRTKTQSGEPLSVGSISHGGGILSKAVHDGLESAGLSSSLVFANDIRQELLEHASEHNPVWSERTVMLAAPMQELVFDHEFMATLPEVDVLEGGIPCNGASVAGRAKCGTECAEAHEDVGHLAVAFLAIVARVNPAVVILENVPPYASSASMWVIRHQLRDLGYVVHETMLNSLEWNALEERKRMCMVAVTQGMEFSMQAVARPEVEPQRLGDVLEEIAHDDPSWSPMQYLKDKQARDLAAGKGFKMQIVSPESSRVGTIGKGYNKNRSTEPKVQHPHNPEMLRLLSPREHAAVKGIDATLVQGMGNTLAHELLGQSIVPAPFVSVAKAVGDAVQVFTAGIARKALSSVQVAARAIIANAQQAAAMHCQVKTDQSVQLALF